MPQPQPLGILTAYLTNTLTAQGIDPTDGFLPPAEPVESPMAALARVRWAYSAAVHALPPASSTGHTRCPLAVQSGDGAVQYPAPQTSTPRKMLGNRLATSPCGDSDRLPDATSPMPG